MKKLLAILLPIFLLTVSALGQWPYDNKPMLGEQIDRSHLLGDPIAFWLFNEGSGNKVFDLSGNNNYGLLEGTAPSWQPGKYGSSVDLPDTDESIRIFYNSSLLATNEITVITSVFPRDWDSDSTILRKGNDWVLLDIDSNQEFRWICFTVGGSIEANIIDASFALNRWYHLAGTYNNGTGEAKIYVDSILRETTGGGSGGLTTGVGELHIGSNEGMSNFFDGRISDMNIYNRVLSTSEIGLLYREPFCMFADDDVAMLEAAIPAPGGQVIFINTAKIPLILISMMLLIAIKRLKANGEES